MKKFLFFALVLMTAVGVQAGKRIDISTLKEEATVTAQNGDTLTGTLSGKYAEIRIAKSATVVLDNVSINADHAVTAWFTAGLSPLGNATIFFMGTNTICGWNRGEPGIFVPVGSTLMLGGNGTLNVSSGYLSSGSIGDASAIGAGSLYQYVTFEGMSLYTERNRSCGNIVIQGGTINATGGYGSAAIGAGNETSCGNIQIKGGTVTANGGNYGAGIGSGAHKSNNDTRYSQCGTIYLSAGTITAKGGMQAAGIGCGYAGQCGDITLAEGITKLTATKGSDAPYSIGKGDGNSSIGTIYIGGLPYVNGIPTSPYVYPIPSTPEQTPECKVPKDLDLVEATSTTAGIYWNTGSASQNQWYLTWKRSEDDVWNYGMSFTKHYVTISGLEPNTSYDVKVKAECGGEAGDSEYTDILTFTTEPSTEGVEDVRRTDVQSTKVLRDGQLMIQVGDKMYDAQGKEVK